MYTTIKGVGITVEENVYIEDFALRLSKLRLKKEVSARDMSLALGLSHNSINNTERMKNFPTMLNFFYICEFLGVTPKDFFDDENKNPTILNELVEELKLLDERQLEHILEITRGLNNAQRG